MKETNSPNPRHLLQEQMVTHLQNLNAKDIDELNLATTRLLRRRAAAGLPVPPHLGSEDLVQQSLFLILAGNVLAELGIDPRPVDVQGKREFLTYIGNVIQSILSDHQQSIDAVDACVADIAFDGPDPSQEAEIGDLTQQLIRRLEAQAKQRPHIAPLLNEWKRANSHSNAVTNGEPRRRAFLVRQLAKEFYPALTHLKGGLNGN